MWHLYHKEINRCITYKSLRGDCKRGMWYPCSMHVCVCTTCLWYLSSMCYSMCGNLIILYLKKLSFMLEWVQCVQTASEHAWCVCIYLLRISFSQILKWSCMINMKPTMHAPQGQPSGNPKNVQYFGKHDMGVFVSQSYTQTYTHVHQPIHITNLKLFCIYPSKILSYISQTCLYVEGALLVVHNGTQRADNSPAPRQLLHHRHRQPSEWWFLLRARVSTHHASVRDNMIDWMLVPI